MSRVDLVIFGATGFTGKHAAMEAARASKMVKDLTWAVAGRSRQKLEDVLKEVAQKTGEDQSHIKIIIAELNNEESLMSMCSGARVVVNCCGPYRLYGEPVVRAAIRSRAHYVDVTGEPQFMEQMQLIYDEEAREAGVYVIHACGFDSIPNDLGIEFLRQNFGGTLHSVESYLDVHMSSKVRMQSLLGGQVNTGTWASVIHYLANIREISALRKKLYPKPMPKFKPILKSKPIIHKKHDKYCIPFPSDESSVYRTQRRLYETEQLRPIQFKPYVKLPNIFSAVFLLLGFGFLYLMSQVKFTKRLLLKYPRLFSAGFITPNGPSEEVMDNTTFSMVLIGKGWSQGTSEEAELNKSVVARVMGTNPGYGATVIALIYSAISVLKEQDKLPGTGGVLTPGAAFRNTRLVNTLRFNKLEFDIVNEKPGVDL